MRTSDSERLRAVTALRRHCADGRLDLDEFEERVAVVLASRTRDQLEELFADLPDLSCDEIDPAPPSRSAAAVRLRGPLAVCLLLVAVLAVAAAVVAAQLLWAAVLVLVWVAGMLAGRLRHRP